MNPLLLSLDLGTTHVKAGLFSADGRLVRAAFQDAETRIHPSGSHIYDPDTLLAKVIDIITEVTEDIDINKIAGIGIASMAETGLLIDKKTGEVRFPLIPWFDAAAIPQVEVLRNTNDPEKRFLRSGIRPNFKCSLAKLLWLRQEFPNLLPVSTWLSTADFIAFRFTGEMGTDYSLAGRTYAFRIDEKSWDEEWLDNLGLPTDIFPPVAPSGRPIGSLNRQAAAQTRLPQGLPVAVCGHDHVCAAFAGIGIDPARIFDSMGTAEALVGNLDKQALGNREYQSGLVFGRHVAGGGYYWMGGMSASGGSLEWLRSILGNQPLTYQDLEKLVRSAPPHPTGILYFPYLSGSGSPHTDPLTRGAFIGLVKEHTRTDVVKAALEGTAFEAEFIRRAAGELVGDKIRILTASGGGTRSAAWLQIKADVSGCTIEVPAGQDATLLGAAMVVGLGLGIYANPQEAFSAVKTSPERIYKPDPSRHQIYQQIYQEGFLPLQAPLREASRILVQG